MSKLQIIKENISEIISGAALIVIVGGGVVWQVYILMEAYAACFARGHCGG